MVSRGSHPQSWIEMYLGVPVPFGVWDYCTQAFVTKPGDYTVYVGTSADDTPHTEPLTVG